MTDSSAIDGGRSRTRRLVRGIGTAFVSRGVSALAPIALVPITLPVMGAELYGVWMTVVALTAMILWADLGLGNGLLTRLTTAFANGDEVYGRRLVSSAYLATAAIASILICLLWISTSIIDISTLLGAAQSSDAAQAERLALVCLTIFLANIPLSLVQRVMYATQRVAEANLWQGLGPVAALLLALGATALTSSAVVIAGAASCGVVIANLFASLRVYGWYGAALRPTPAKASPREMYGLFGLGAKFFLLSIITSTALGIDNLIVSNVLGLAAVAVFAVQARIANLMGMVINLVNLPLWPATGEALTRGDIRWVRRTVRLMIPFSFGAVVLATVTIVVIGPLLEGALNLGELDFDRALFVTFGLWWILVAATSPLAMVQNSQGVVAPQLVGWAAYLVLSIPLKVIALGSADAWIVPVIGFATFAVTVGPSQVIGYRIALARAVSRGPFDGASVNANQLRNA